MKLRLAKIDDCRLLFEYRNDPVVIENSLTNSPVAWADHVKWYEQKIKDDECLIYIAEENSEPVGQVRLDNTDNVATISYSVDSKYRGNGYGVRIIEEIEKIAVEHSISALIAFVIKTNKASTHIFTMLGYTEVQQKSTFRYEKVINQKVQSR